KGETSLKTRSYTSAIRPRDSDDTSSVLTALLCFHNIIQQSAVTNRLRPQGLCVRACVCVCVCARSRHSACSQSSPCGEHRGGGAEACAHCATQSRGLRPLCHSERR